MTVTAVQYLDKRKSRVLLDQEIALILYPADLRQFHIEEGGELPEESYRLLVETVLKPRAWERTLRTLQVSDKTEKELQELLRREGYPEEAVREALTRALAHHYIDDRAYGLRYVEQRGGKKSSRQLRAEMERKGFAESLVEELLEEHPVDEAEQARQLLEKKGFRPGDELDEKQYLRSVRMLARRGYPYGVIREVLGDLKTFFD